MDAKVETLENNKPALLPFNEYSIRRWSLERTLELVRGEGALRKDDFGFCGMQDMKCQIVDCAKALSEFLMHGSTPTSIVGITTLLLSASRLLKDRGIILSVAAFNALMKSKKLMSLGDAGVLYLTNTGLAYGTMKPRISGATPYYYDNKFDELLQVLEITEAKDEKNRKNLNK